VLKHENPEHRRMIAIEFTEEERNNPRKKFPLDLALLRKGYRVIKYGENQHMVSGGWWEPIDTAAPAWSNTFVSIESLITGREYTYILPPALVDQLKCYIKNPDEYHMLNTHSTYGLWKLIGYNVSSRHIKDHKYCPREKEKCKKIANDHSEQTSLYKQLKAQLLASKNHAKFLGTLLVDTRKQKEIVKKKLASHNVKWAGDVQKLHRVTKENKNLHERLCIEEAKNNGLRWQLENSQGDEIQITSQRDIAISSFVATTIATSIRWIAAAAMVSSIAYFLSM
jgi:hypothetical protein